MRRFSVALLFVMLLVLAAAIPRRVDAPRYKAEIAAVKAISTVHTAETQYYSQYGHYATSLSQLGPPATGAPGPNAADLIDVNLARGIKGGFKFVLYQMSNGYALVVNPTTFGTSGTHTYYSDQSMTIHQHHGQKPATVSDPPLGDAPLRLPKRSNAAADQNTSGRYPTVPKPRTISFRTGTVQALSPS